MILLLVNQLLVNWVAKIKIQIKLFLENVEKFHNCMKIPFFGLKIRLLFTDLFRIRFRIRIRIRIQNVYFGSGSDPDPANSFGSLRIRFRIRIRNAAWGASNPKVILMLGSVLNQLLSYKKCRKVNILKSLRIQNHRQRFCFIDGLNKG